MNGDRSDSPRRHRITVRLSGSRGRLHEAVESLLAPRQDVALQGDPTMHADVILLIAERRDVNDLPEMAREAALPMLCLTEDADDDAMTALLEAGVLGHLTWPVDARTLAAWLHWAQRRGAPQPSSNVASGLRLDPSIRSAYWDGRPLALPPREFDVLAHLAGYEGRTVPRRSIIDSIWQGEIPVTSRALDVRISNLRRALAAVSDGGEVPRIDTVEGIGYKLVTR